MMLYDDNRRWDLRNEHHISFGPTRTCSGAGFIGTTARIGGALALAATLTLASCKDTKDVRPIAGDSPSRLTEPTGDGGAAGSPPREARWTPGGADPSAAPVQPVPADPANASRQGWAVVLGTSTAENHREQAQKFIDGWREVCPYPDMWVESDARGSIVRYGSYPTMDSKAAQTDLTNLKHWVYNNARPFAGAYLSRIASGVAGRVREYHLVQARQMFPGEDIVYSLQIGVYEAEQDTTTEQARRLAEDAVAQLRAQGEMAFYYHGPNRSMVCVGAFSSDAVDAATGLYSPEVAALQRRFPYNSFNGRSLRQEILTNSGKRRVETQPSFLVRVPTE